MEYSHGFMWNYDLFSIMALDELTGQKQHGTLRSLSTYIIYRYVVWLLITLQIMDVITYSCRTLGQSIMTNQMLGNYNLEYLLICDREWVASVPCLWEQLH